MTRIIYPDTEFETNGDGSKLQINFDRESYFEDEVSELREKFKTWGLPVFMPAIPEPFSIVFCVLAICKTCGRSREKTYGENNEWCENCVPY